MISTEIEFSAPGSLEGVLSLLDEHGYDVTVLSGGMSLLPMMNLGLATPERVVSLNRVDSLRHVAEVGAELAIGATVPHAEVAVHPLIKRYCPALTAAASRIGDVQVRNRGTIGGSISHADPSADYLPVLLACGARIVLDSVSASRELAADDFFVDLMLTARQPNELVTGIRIPKPQDGVVSSYLRFARVEGSFAIVNAAVALAPNGGRSTLALGGVGPRPVMVDISGYGRAGWDDAAVAAVGDAAFEASSGATSDSMSDAEYKREMARVHARRVVRAALEQARPPS